MVDQHRRATLTTRAVVLGLAFCAVVVMLAYPLREYLAQRSEISALRSEQAARQQRVDGLQRDVARWQDPVYVRSQARERLHFVLPGEATYVVLAPPRPPAVHMQRVGQRVVAVPDGTWYGRLWSTATVAARAAPARPAR